MSLVIVGPNQDTVYRHSTIVDNVAANGLSVVRFNQLFFPFDPGIYSFRLTYRLPNSASSTTHTQSITISAGLGSPNTTTIYTIGSGTFPTFRSAIEALYTRGVAGHVVFEFTTKNIVG
jgi:hypothetical protein